MSTYLYAPKGGSAGSCFSGGSPVYCNGSSCNGSSHASVRCSYPLDISGSGDAYIYIDPKLWRWERYRESVTSWRLPRTLESLAVVGLPFIELAVSALVIGAVIVDRWRVASLIALGGLVTVLLIGQVAIWEIGKGVLLWMLRQVLTHRPNEHVADRSVLRNRGSVGSG